MAEKQIFSRKHGLWAPISLPPKNPKVHMNLRRPVGWDYRSLPRVSHTPEYLPWVTPIMVRCPEFIPPVPDTSPSKG